jgi:AcrR family transcriptional regulator
MASLPKFQRRKEARPGEIVKAALRVFGEKGFAAARLDEIAARAGVSKGALYLYFETKEDLFRAVVTEAVVPNVARIREMMAGFQGPFPDFVSTLARLFARTATRSPFGAIAKMVIGESRNFPALARHWHEAVVAPTLSLLIGVIARAQERGEVRPGDPRLYAVQLVGPFVLAVLWRETFVPVGAEPIDLERLAEQHARTQVLGLLVRPEEAAR